MFSPPPEESQNKTIHNNPRKRRKKKINRNKTQQAFKNKTKRKHSKFALTMSTWAESFTVAATWQLKHQLAYWKAKAKSLEYENEVLHDIIRRNTYNEPSSSGCVKTEQVDDDMHENEQRNDYDNEEECEQEDEEEVEEEENDEFEVSEEYIEFLRANAKYKEDARLERERLRNKAEDETTDLEMGPPEKEDYQEKLKELYGDKWQRISAMEMALQSLYINECDKSKPMFWPNIPFNFNFG